jgi:Zn-dependent protease
MEGVRQSLRLGRFAGIDVGVNWSVLVIFGLLTWELAYVVFPSSPFGGPTAADWVAAVVATAAFFVSLLAHEVSHAVVARHNGVGVRSITLWLFGGVAQLEGEAHTAGADFRIAAVGPGTSIALAVVFALGQLAADAAGAAGLVVTVLSWLWKINLLLAAFNLIPAAPLDGGRILRAGLWRAWGDRTRASLAAARAGRGFGIVLIAVGIVEFAYGGVTGLWPALLGWFLYSAAGMEERAARLRGGLGHLRVGQVMTPNPPAVPAGVTVAELVDRVLWHWRGDALAVVDDHGWLAGVLPVRAVQSVPPDRRAVTAVGQLAVPLAAVPVARVDEPLQALLERMAGASGVPALVLDGDRRLAGIVTDTDLERAAALGATATRRQREPAWR